MNRLRLTLGAQTSRVELHTGEAGPVLLELPIGCANLWPARRSGPSALDVETAIQTVEDQIETFQARVPRGSTAFEAHAEALATLARKARQQGAHDSVFSLAQIEAWYQQLAARAVLAPSASGSGFDAPEGDAAVLLLREFMHHLGLHAVLLRS